LPPYVRLLQLQIGQEVGHPFEEPPIFIREGISLIAVDIDLADDIISCADRHDYLGSRLWEAGKVAWIGVYISDNHRLPRARRKATDPLPNRDAYVLCRLWTIPCGERKFLTLAYVDPYPVKLRNAAPQLAHSYLTGLVRL